MGAILTLARKDLRILVRDRFAMFWIFAFPLMYGLFFGSLFGGGAGGGGARIPVVIVDEAGTAASRELIAALAGHASLDAQEARDQDGGDASRPMVVPLDQARDLVRLGRRAAYLRIPAGYDPSPFALFGGGPAAGGGSAAGAIEVGIDPSRRAEAGFLQGILMEAMFGGMAGRFADRAAMRQEIARSREQLRAADGVDGLQRGVLLTFLGALDRFFADADLGGAGAGAGAHRSGGSGGPAMADTVHVVDVARSVGQQPRSSFEITFPASMMWGLMSVALGFAITIVRERTQGTMLRLRTAPLGRAQLLAGKALACWTMCLIVMASLLLFGSVALGVAVQDVPLLLLAMVCTATCFTGLMMTVAVLGKTESAVAGASWGLMMPFAMIGGGMVPLIAMPKWLLALSDFSFFKWGIYALEGAIWRGFGLADMVGPCAVLVGIGAVFFGLGVALFRRSDG